jgi:hypothetical protein
LVMAYNLKGGTHAENANYRGLRGRRNLNADGRCLASWRNLIRDLSFAAR